LLQQLWYFKLVRLVEGACPKECFKQAMLKAFSDGELVGETSIDYPCKEHEGGLPCCCFILSFIAPDAALLQLSLC